MAPRMCAIAGVTVCAGLLTACGASAPPPPERAGAAAAAVAAGFGGGISPAASGSGPSAGAAPVASGGDATVADAVSDDRAGIETVAQLQRLRPLTAADVDFYASVMQAAVARLDHPTPDDIEVLRQATAIERGSAGVDPDAMARNAAIMERAVELQTHLDDAIVRERHLDAARYAVLRDRIENVIPPLEIEGAGGGGSPSDAPSEPATAEQREFRRLFEARSRADAAFLAPRRAELQRLIRRVRLASRAAPER